MQLLLNSFPICKGSGKFPHGTTEIPFVFNLQGGQTRVLHETYHGVFINIQYFMKVDMKRGLLAKDLDKSCEFIVESLVSVLCVRYIVIPLVYAFHFYFSGQKC